MKPAELLLLGALGMNAGLVLADDEPPDAALLEFLGEWDGDDDWLDRQLAEAADAPPGSGDAVRPARLDGAGTEPADGEKPDETE